MVFPDQNDIPLRVHLRLLLYNSSYPLMIAIQRPELPLLQYLTFGQGSLNPHQIPSYIQVHGIPDKLQMDY